MWFSGVTVAQVSSWGCIRLSAGTVALSEGSMQGGPALMLIPTVRQNSVFPRSFNWGLSVSLSFGNRPSLVPSHVVPSKGQFTTWQRASPRTKE